MRPGIVANSYSHFVGKRKIFPLIFNLLAAENIENSYAKFGQAPRGFILPCMNQVFS